MKRSTRSVKTNITTQHRINPTLRPPTQLRVFARSLVGSDSTQTCRPSLRGDNILTHHARHNFAKVRECVRDTYTRSYTIGIYTYTILPFLFLHYARGVLYRFLYSFVARGDFIPLCWSKSATRSHCSFAPYLLHTCWPQTTQIVAQLLRHALLDFYFICLRPLRLCCCKTPPCLRKLQIRTIFRSLLLL